MGAFLLLTNNPLVRDTYPDRPEVIYKEGGYRELLVAVRDMVHRGHVVLSHPLSGSIKPKETPYKSIFVTPEPQSALDNTSLLLIENSIITCDKFVARYESVPPELAADFATVDLSLVQSTLELLRVF